MSLAQSLRFTSGALLLVLVLATECRGGAFVRGAYYRMGDDDPGAVAGATANSTTRDSFADALDLKRYGTPTYANVVPPGWPSSKLSMHFDDPATSSTNASLFHRTSSLALDQGYSLELWARPDPFPITDPGGPPETRILAYDGTPNLNGFGFYSIDGDFALVVGGHLTWRTLGPTNLFAWHHIAYVQSLGTSSYYYDGALVATSTTDPIPAAPTGGIWVGGFGDNTSGDLLFHGWIDEVRFQTFNPLAAGAFNPTDFLIVPEPATVGLFGVFFGVALLHRRARTVIP